MMPPCLGPVSPCGGMFVSHPRHTAGEQPAPAVWGCPRAPHQPLLHPGFVHPGAVGILLAREGGLATGRPGGGTGSAHTSFSRIRGFAFLRCDLEQEMKAT